MAQFKTLADKPVEVKVEEEDLAIWDLADKAAGAVQEVTAADALAVTADVDQVAMVVAADAMAAVTVAVVTVAVVTVVAVTVVEDATAEAAVTEAVDLEWEGAACQDLGKVVLHNQKRKSGMQAYLIP